MITIVFLTLLHSLSLASPEFIKMAKASWDQIFGLSQHLISREVQDQSSLPAQPTKKKGMIRSVYFPNTFVASFSSPVSSLLLPNSSLASLLLLGGNVHGLLGVDLPAEVEVLGVDRAHHEVEASTHRHQACLW